MALAAAILSLVLGVLFGRLDLKVKSNTLGYTSYLFLAVGWTLLLVLLIETATRVMQ